MTGEQAARSAGSFQRMQRGDQRQCALVTCMRARINTMDSRAILKVDI